MGGLVEMSAMRIIQKTATQWSLQHALHPMLRKVGGQHSPEQDQGQCYVGLYRQASGAKPGAGDCGAEIHPVNLLSHAERQILARVKGEPMSWEVDRGL